MASDPELLPEQGQVGPPLTLHLAGDLDIASLPGLKKLIREAINTPPPNLVIVDMSDVTFMDCSSLGALVAARAHLGPRMKLQEPPPPVVRLLKVTKLYEELVDRSPR